MAQFQAKAAGASGACRSTAASTRDHEARKAQSRG